jgi:sugar lactone lactonase YvrE
LIGLLLAACPSAWAQQYVISIFAGGQSLLTPIAGVDASIGRPSTVATDSAGNVYFGVSLGCVFKLDGNGILTRAAGTCRAGYSGDGGPATQAQLGAGQSLGVAVDSAGNLYIADSVNNRIRMVAPNGVITTVANVFANRLAVDSGGALYFTLSDSIRKLGPGGAITTVVEHSGGIYDLGGLAVDSGGNIYVADTSRYRVLQVSSAGVITTVASDGAFDNSGVVIGGLYPKDVAVDAAGNLYIVDFDNNSVYKVSPGGSVTKLAGQGFYGSGYSGDGDAATSAKLNEPTGVAVDSAGNVYIADQWNNRVRMISLNGAINTIAGNGTYSFSGDGGPASQAQLGGPSGAAFDSAGNLYFADMKNDRVRKISPDGTITTVGGNGTPGSSGDGGPATSAQVNLSSADYAGVTVDPAGNVYIADVGNQRIRKISPDGVMSAVTAGGPDIAADSAGSVYFTDSGNIRKVLSDGTIASVTQDAGPIALDSAGNLYLPVSTFPGYGIRKISPDGVAATVANVSSGLPVALAVDSNGNVYVAAYAPFSNLPDGRVHKVSPSGVVTIIAGTQTAGYSGDGGPATSALLNPSALAVDSSGNVLVVDSVNDVIRRLQPSGP